MLLHFCIIVSWSTLTMGLHDLKSCVQFYQWKVRSISI